MTKTLFALMLAGLIVATPAAYATSPILDASADADAGVEVRSDRGKGYGQEKRDDARAAARATTTASSSDSAKAEGRTDVQASTTASHGRQATDEYRSRVAAFVHALLADADRAGGIGAQVRAVAQSQNDLASTTVDAMTKVETRSRLMTFLFGSDWESLGVLKTTIRNMQDDAAALEAAIESTTDAQVRASLEAQLQVLKDEQARIEAFVEARENRFSLFGWLTRLLKSDPNA